MATKRGALAIDHGTKRTGFAAADPLRISLNALEPFHGPGDAPAAEPVNRGDHRAGLIQQLEIHAHFGGVPIHVVAGHNVAPGRGRGWAIETQAAHADRHGLLHGLGAEAHQRQRIGQRQ